MRIRTLKPEWLDDERLLEAGSDARLMSVAMILLSDDYGNGRASERVLAGRLFPCEPDGLDRIRAGLGKLRGWYLDLYTSGGQSYYHIRNWSRHQRVDKPGKPLVPGPKDADNAGKSEAPANVPEPPAKIPGTPASDPETPTPDRDLDPDPKDTDPEPYHPAHAREGDDDCTPEPMPPQEPAKAPRKAKRAEGESVAKVFNAAFREAATRERGELTPGNMYPYVAHREEFDGLAILCRSLGGEDWPVFIKWWWRSTKAGGWAAARLTVATPKALLKAWQSNVAEWRDPERFAAERKRPDVKTEDPRQRGAAYQELPDDEG